MRTRNRMRLRVMLCGAVAIMAALSPLSTQASEERTVKLPNGKTYQVMLVYNQPQLFKNSKVEVLSVGLTQRGALDVNHPRIAWLFKFELSGNNSYDITVRSPLDDSIEVRIGGEGPGEVEHEIMSCTDFPAMCYWVGQEGGAFIPFHFTFRNRKNGREFSFMQWYRVTPWDKSFFKAHEEVREK